MLGRGVGACRLAGQLARRRAARRCRSGEARSGLGAGVGRRDPRRSPGPALFGNAASIRSISSGERSGAVVGVVLARRQREVGSCAGGAVWPGQEYDGGQGSPGARGAASLRVKARRTATAGSGQPPAPQAINASSAVNVRSGVPKADAEMLQPTSARPSWPDSNRSPPGTAGRDSWDGLGNNPQPAASCGQCRLRADPARARYRRSGRAPGE